LSSLSRPLFIPALKSCSSSSSVSIEEYKSSVNGESPSPILCYTASCLYKSNHNAQFRVVAVYLMPHFALWLFP
jgi:hypothetical protein